MQTRSKFVSYICLGVVYVSTVQQVGRKLGFLYTSILQMKRFFHNLAFQTYVNSTRDEVYLRVTRVQLNFKESRVLRRNVVQHFSPDFCRLIIVKQMIIVELLIIV